MFIDMQTHHRGGGTAFGAHVGGFLAGMALAGCYRLFAQKKEMQEEELLEEESAAPELQPVVAPRQTTVRAPIRLCPAQSAEVAPATPSETPTIFLHDNEQQTGPFTLSQVQQMLRDGKVSASAYYWSEGMSNWQNATE